MPVQERLRVSRGRFFCARDGPQRTAEPLVAGELMVGWGRAMRVGGGRAQVHPCSACFAPSMALNTPAHPHRPALHALPSRQPRKKKKNKSKAASRVIAGLVPLLLLLLFSFLRGWRTSSSVRGRVVGVCGGVERQGWRETRPAGAAFAVPHTPLPPGRPTQSSTPATRGSAVRRHHNASANKNPGRSRGLREDYFFFGMYRSVIVPS